MNQQRHSRLRKIIIAMVTVAMLVALVPQAALATPDPSSNPPLTSGGIRIDPGVSGTYTMGSPGVTVNPPVSSNFSVTITITDTPQGPTLSFTSNLPITKVVVKGGTGDAQIYNYNPAVYSASGLHCAINPSGLYAGVSHVDFYFACSYPIRITKTDAVTNLGLAGAVFGIYNGNTASATLLETLPATGSNGTAQSTKSYVPGTYYIKEISAPAGYVLDTNYYPITVSVCQPGGVASLCQPIANTRIKYPIQVTKVDSATQLGLAGAIFGIYSSNTGSATLLETLPATNASGVAQSVGTYKPGTYYVREITAPLGYVPDNTFYAVTVNIGQTGGVATRTAIPNTLIKYPIEITKVDSVTHLGLPGALFGIYDGNTESATLLETLPFTNLSGVARSVKTYAPGTYYVKEITAPSGYALDSTFYAVTVNAGQAGGVATRAAIPNSLIRYPIKAQKLDLIGLGPVAGAVFGIYDLSGTLLETMPATGANGYTQSVNTYAPGVYYIQEITAPAGYLLNLLPVFVIVQPNQPGSVAEALAPVINARISYPIQIRKVDAVNGAPLSGAVFGIYDGSTDSATLLETLPATDADGYAQSAKTYAPGTYYVKEITAPAGYEPDSNYYMVKVCIAQTGSVATRTAIGNARTPYPIRLTKRDAVDEHALSGAVYGIYDGNTESATLLETLPATDADGAAQSVKKYTPGTYYVHEITAPAGYELDPVYYPVTVNINQQGGVADVGSLFDPRTPYPIRLTKWDSTTEQPLAGAIFGIYDGNTDTAVLLETLAATDASGAAQSAKNYAPGTYYVKEITAPAGYDTDSTFYPVTVGINQEGGVALVGPVLNERTKYNIRIIKEDAETGAKLAGAKFEIYLGTTLVDTVTSGDEGLALSKLLAPGSYTVKEITPPDGYDLNDKVEPAVITVAGGDITVTFKNTKIDIPEETPPYGPTSTPITIEETDPPYGSTGESSSALPFVIAGLLLAAAAMLVIFNHKRESVQN